MDRIQTIFNKIQNNSFQLEWIEEILKIDKRNLKKLLQITRKITDKNFGNILKSYIPGKNFPAISITGSQCFLNCKHCNKHYLELMINADSPEKLIDVCQKLKKEGAIGCLISGGFDKNFALPFEPYVSALTQIKKTTGLILNVHTGLISKNLAEKLGKTGIDIVSFDIVGDKETIKNVYGIDKTPQDYLKSLKALKNAKIKYIAPHICIGLNYGKLSGEIEALKLIKEEKPYLIVLLALIPTKNTAMEHIKLQMEYIIKIISIARLMFPTTSISLGCMRPGGAFRQQLDLLAFQAGITRIEIPSNSLINYAINNGYVVQKINSCCSLPSEFEFNFENNET